MPHSPDIYNWTNNWTCFWKFRGNCPVALPLIARSARNTCQHHLETKAANAWDLVQSNKWNLATQTGQLSSVDLNVDTTTDKLTRIRTSCRFCKIDQMYYETRHSKYSFALSIHLDVRTKTSQLRRIPTSLHRCILTSHVILYCMKRILHKCSLTLRHIGHTRTDNGFFKLVDALL